MAVAAHSVHAVGGAERESVSTTKAVHFPQSFLYCSPTNSGIWVRVQMECSVLVTDIASQQSDLYVLGVMAKTGVTTDPTTGKPGPGYDYSIIFSKDHVFTKRSHSSAYLNNPTVLTHAQFGEAKWQLREVPCEPLRDAAAIRLALESWRELTARTTFVSADSSRSVSIEYPVKWADFNLDSSGFRVETGPIVLLDPDQVKFGETPHFSDFHWAHFDYHSFDKVRCLMEQRTSILADATFTPPKEDGREVRETPGLTVTAVDRVRHAIQSATGSTMSPETSDLLLSTDHYSLAKEFNVKTEIFALTT